MTDTRPIVTMRGICKRFGGDCRADRRRHGCLRPGEVLAIVGDNGAGKSTLIKILTGVYQPTSGAMEMDGRPLEMNSHSDAIARGIDAVYQTLALADHLDAAANVFLGNELTHRIAGVTLLDNQRMRTEAERVLFERIGVRLPDMSAAAESLSGGQRQAIAIARAVYHTDLRVLVMDEPTAALGPQETERTLNLIADAQEPRAWRSSSSRTLWMTCSQAPTGCWSCDADGGPGS